MVSTKLDYRLAKANRLNYKDLQWGIRSHNVHKDKLKPWWNLLIKITRIYIQAHHAEFKSFLRIVLVVLGLSTCSTYRQFLLFEFLPKNGRNIKVTEPLIT